MNIKDNMGNIDRIIRSIAAVIFVVSFFQGFTSGASGIALLFVSIYFLATAIFGLCPIYKMVGFGTKAREAEKA
ncbi:MAG: DUF2892 domain-containing protein [Chitinophagales bacterium]